MKLQIYFLGGMLLISQTFYAMEESKEFKMTLNSFKRLLIMECSSYTNNNFGSLSSNDNDRQQLIAQLIGQNRISPNTRTSFRSLRVRRNLLEEFEKVAK